jgi:nucleotide-binding universal stress UspA family protein
MVVLIPYDGSQPAQQAVEYAIDNCGDQRIVLLRVIEFADGSLEAGFDLIKERLKESREEGAAQLSEELLETLNDSTVDYDVETVVGKPVREIVDYAEANDVSHIVIGSHGRTGASRVLLGSVAQTVVRRAPTPVTVVR